MITKQQIPFVRIVMFFILGILIADSIRIYNIILPIIGFIILIITILGVIKRWSITTRWIPGSLLVFIIILIGYSTYIMHIPSYKSGYIKASGTKEDLWHIQVSERPKQGKRLRFVANTLAYAGPLNDMEYDDLKYANGKVLFYLDTTAINFPIQVGDEFLVKTKIFPIKENHNPDVFDYQTYLYYRGINFQSYISKKNIVEQLQTKHKSIFHYSQYYREIFSHILKKYLPDQKQQSIAIAMILGIKDKIDATLYDSFTNSGAVHVLAVSGLHVGFVAMIIFFLLKLFPFKSKSFNVFKTIVIIICIFGYGLLTGMAPAIMRATIMYSIFIIAKAWRPATSNYNILAFSAFLMLLYNPFMLFQAGFQFSYLAILGIMIFYNPIKKLVYTKNNLLSYFWNMISVSLAAQIMVFPITIFYFHKFPTYFFISGLLAIPAAAFILSIGISLIAFEFILPGINKILLAPLLQKVLNILIYGIDWISNWPMASIDGIFITKWMMLLIYISIGMALLYRSQKKKIYFLMALTSFSFFLLLNIITLNSYKENKDFIIYDSYNNSCIDFFINNTVYNIKSATLKDKEYKYLTYNHRLKKAVDQVINLPYNMNHHDHILKFQNNFLQIGDKTFYFAASNQLEEYTNRPKIDYLVLSDKTNHKLHKYIDIFEIGTIIIDHSIPRKQLWKWKKESKKIDVVVHIIQEDGVFKGAF